MPWLVIVIVTVVPDCEYVPVFVKPSPGGVNVKLAESFALLSKMPQLRLHLFQKLQTLMNKFLDSDD